MSISITLTLTLGTNTGPSFTLYCPTGVVSPNTATKSELELGKTVTVSDDNASQIHVISTGTCNNTVVIGIPSLPITTTTTTTSTTTTTTTIAVPVSDYYADKYDCDTCTLVSSSVIVALPTSYTAIINNYYTPTIPDGFAYKIISVSPTGPGLVLNELITGLSCASVCIV